MDEIRLLIAIPTGFEASGIRRVCNRELKAVQAKFSIAICGIGEDLFVGRLAQHVGSFQPTHVLIAGFCGALRQEINVGDVFGFSVEKNIENLVKQFYTSRMPILNPRIKSQIAAENPSARVVDMETLPALEFCLKKGIPCSAIRVVSDSFDQNLPLNADLLTALASGQSGALPKLALHLAMHPWELFDFIRLARSSFKARDALANEFSRWARSVGIHFAREPSDR